MSGYWHESFCSTHAKLLSTPITYSRFLSQYRNNPLYCKNWETVYVMPVLSKQMTFRIQQVLSLRSWVTHLWSFLKRKHQKYNIWKWCVQNFALAAREIRQFGGKSSTARRQTYSDILADTALRIFIQFPSRTVGTSRSTLVPVKRWPIIRKGVLTGKSKTQ